jgi:uroporphyrin-III C-methyltransferase/precorrin-2 dehydrogenase/sirohydrochlorin ferrochelatase
MITLSAEDAPAEPTPHPGRAGPPRYLPLAVDMERLRCLVVGGGRIGTRKALKLADAGAEVTILAPEISAKLRARVRSGSMRWCQGAYHAAVLDGFALVVAATPDHRVNLCVRRDADARGILCCVVAPGRLSRVIFPAVHRDERITVAVHSDGRDCRLSQRVRDLVACWWRKRGTPRGSDGSSVRRVRAGAITPPGREPDGSTSGKVSIVGAGPGAPDLISVRGYQALRAADVVLIDRLLSPTFLDDLGIPSGDKTIEWLGDHRPPWSQAEINQRLVLHARAGRNGVRLKGGDPFVFGRGDAEIAHLDEHGVAWEVVPGCTSATAVLTSAGFPLTRHGRGRSFAVATARVAGGGLPDAFPRTDSLVILMGVGVLDQVVRRLVADGWREEAPAAVIERGTLPNERMVIGPLSAIASLAVQTGVASPALIVVGEAARRIAAFEGRPTIPLTDHHPSPSLSPYQPPARAAACS